MKRFLIPMVKRLGRHIPFKWLKGLSTGMLLPFYHVVSDDPLPHIKSYNYPGVDAFQRDLDYLLKHYAPAGLDELFTATASSHNLFHLSFDDGLRQCYDIIAPLLLRKGIPATFFINPGFVDNRQLFHRHKAGLILTHAENFSSTKNILVKSGITPVQLMQISGRDSELLDRIAEEAGISFADFLQSYRPYMTLGQIAELQAAGFTIGGHSWDHPEFYTISEQEQFDQIRRSMEWMDAHFPQRKRIFAFPFTDDGIRTRLLRRVYDSGICDLTFGTAGLKRDIFPGHLQRLSCETGFSLESILKGELVYSGLRRITGKSVVKRD